MALVYWRVVCCPSARQMLPLTLRPTRLHASALRQLADWSVLHDGKVIGRISETHAPYRPELAWSWSITELLDSRAGVTSHGNAASLEEAKTAIQASWDAWQAWPRPAAETAELFRWYGDVLGAAFAYWDGRRLERPIDAADWPVIDGLKTVGRLTYRDDDARALEAKLRRSRDATRPSPRPSVPPCCGGRRALSLADIHAEGFWSSLSDSLVPSSWSSLPAWSSA